MEDYTRFKIEKEGFTTRLILNRPEKHNAMDLPFFTELLAAFVSFDEDPDVRVIIIQGEGKNFSSGLDLGTLPGLVQSTAADAREGLRRMILKAQESMTAIENCRKPVIAAAHGVCIGGAVDLLSACDIRFASGDAVFSIRETKMAMVADLGTLQRMPHIIGESWFRELALSGRNFTAEEALRINFISRICEDTSSLYREARDLAEEIAGCSPLAVQGVKDVMRFNREHGVRAGLEYVAQKNAAILMSEDLLEAAQAFAEKRPPRFKGR
ncbi:MAG: crotonase/enoyl-CoA hydratase family protein [Deltaproteobacteria bacterium]|nr:crotonase/enoyl-CoA hydratase family protein [Deltaproteobacteria bacterium]